MARSSIYWPLQVPGLPQRIVFDINDCKALAQPEITHRLGCADSCHLDPGDADDGGLREDLFRRGIGGRHDQAVLGVAQVQGQQVQGSVVIGEFGLVEFEGVGAGLVVEEVGDGVFAHRSVLWRVEGGMNVGGGLLPMAECQSVYLQLTHCHREQAPSHRLISIYLIDITLVLIYLLCSGF